MVKFFDTICAMLRVRRYLMTAYSFQTVGQTERLNETIVQRLPHYVEEYQRYWDIYLQPLTFAFNLQVHSSTKKIPFDLVLTRHPFGLVTTGATLQRSSTGAKKSMGPVQCKKATFCHFKNVLSHER